MCERVPNLDLRFFVTAIVLQRQTGGDLAEILDKIGSLIRERFKIWGQIQALTGEGRLSGIVLLALPPALFVVMYYLNPDYCTVLFTDPLGHKMLAGGRRHADRRCHRHQENHQHQGLVRRAVCAEPVTSRPARRSLTRVSRPMAIILLAVIGSSLLLPILAFILFGSAAWLLMDLFSSRASTAEQRLDEFKDPNIRRRKEAEGTRRGMSTETVARVWEKASPALAKPLQPKNENEVGKLKTKMAQAGFRSEAAPSLFLSLKFAMLIAGLFLGGGDGADHGPPQRPAVARAEEPLQVHR